MNLQKHMRLRNNLGFFFVKEFANFTSNIIETIKKIKMEEIKMKKLLMQIIAIISGITMTITLIMINCFGVDVLMNVMSTATLLFIMSGMYLAGYDDGKKEDEE